MQGEDSSLTHMSIRPPHPRPPNIPFLPPQLRRTCSGGCVCVCVCVSTPAPGSDTHTHTGGAAPVVPDGIAALLRAWESEKTRTASSSFLPLAASSAFLAGVMKGRAPHTCGMWHRAPGGGCVCVCRVAPPPHHHSAALLGRQAAAV